MTKEEYGRDENAAPAKDTTFSRVGDIVFSPLGTPRAGVLVCDGSAVSRQTYKELFDFLGVSCGEGDGETTFNLPDLRDQWILCAGTEHEAGANVAEGLPNITGLYGGNNILTNQTSAPNVEGAIYAATIASGGTYDSTSGRYNLGGFRFSAALSNSIYGASDHVTPKSTVLTPCIVYE